MLRKGHLQLDIFPEVYINVEELIPPKVIEPSIPEGETELVITGYHVTEENYGYYHQGKKRVTITFSNEQGQTFSQTYYIDKYNPNLAKFIYQVLWNIPEGEFSLKTLKGRKIRAFLYHNYTNEGRGYVNIASCEPIE
ncbi:hypothetical protein P9386_08125 [Caldifermentibacillus hisashii]|uniref:hypothetical protein n=1 Tax=Caldifermentibacillus hisashii TaxID=996558 RepID=UPI002E1C7527|nr:hypothetical protein [Caldifermentibacillus hisashii]